MKRTPNDYERLFGRSNLTPYVKDAFHRHLINSDPSAINPEREGTKAAAMHCGLIQPGETCTVRLRLANVAHKTPFRAFLLRKYLNNALPKLTSSTPPSRTQI
jgi:hypothetical protein